MAHIYCLADNVYASWTGSFCIFLNLELDKYFSIPAAPLNQIAPVIRGLGAAPPGISAPVDFGPRDRTEMLNGLLAAGLIEIAQAEARSSATSNAPPPLADALSLDGDGSNSFIFRFYRSKAAYALVSAQILLNTSCILRIVTDVARRRRYSASCTSYSDKVRTVELARRFMRARPFYPKNGVCLLDSLALIRFLSLYNTFPRWVFGVREEPFKAHCWVQTDDIVLNDYHEQVSAYQPIMTI